MTTKEISQINKTLAMLRIVLLSKQPMSMVAKLRIEHAINALERVLNDRVREASREKA